MYFLHLWEHHKRSLQYLNVYNRICYYSDNLVNVLKLCLGICATENTNTAHTHHSIMIFLLMCNSLLIQRKQYIIKLNITKFYFSIKFGNLCKAQGEVEKLSRFCNRSWKNLKESHDYDCNHVIDFPTLPECNINSSACGTQWQHSMSIVPPSLPIMLFGVQN